MLTLIEDKISREDHVLVDEYFLGNKNVFLAGLVGVRKLVKSLWLAVGAIDTTLVSDDDLDQIKSELAGQEYVSRHESEVDRGLCFGHRFGHAQISKSKS